MDKIHDSLFFFSSLLTINLACWTRFILFRVQHARDIWNASHEDIWSFEWRVSGYDVPFASFLPASSPLSTDRNNTPVRYQKGKWQFLPEYRIHWIRAIMWNVRLIWHFLSRHDSANRASQKKVKGALREIDRVQMRQSDAYESQDN